MPPAGSSSYVSPSQLRPYPSAEQSRSTVKGRPAVRAEIKAESPYKNQFFAQKAQKSEKQSTPYLFCEILYCDSNVQWFRCKNCCLWFCKTCAGLSAKEKKSRRQVFVCTNCKQGICQSWRTITSHQYYFSFVFLVLCCNVYSQYVTMCILLNSVSVVNSLSILYAHSAYNWDLCNF